MRGLTLLGAATVLARADTVATEVFDDGAVLWDGARAQLHRLDVVGAAVWAQVDGQRSLAEITGALAGQFGIDERTVRRDLTGFLQDLLDKGVLIYQD